MANGHVWGDDYAAYISQAKSIVEGTIDELIAINKHRVENSTLWIGPVVSPWGLSLLLSPIYYLFGLDIHVMKIYLVFFFLTSILAFFLLFKDTLSNAQNLLLVTVFGLNPWFFDYRDNVFSDMPYVFFSLLTLLFIKRFVMLNKIWISELTGYGLIGFFIFFSSFIRPFGFLLLPTLLCAQYFYRKGSFKDFIFSGPGKFTPYIIFITLTAISSWIFSGESITGHSAKLFNEIRPGSIFFNIKYYTIVPARYFPYLFVKYNVFGLGYDKIHLIVYTVILLLVFYGMIQNRKEDYIYILYILFNIMLVIFFPPRAPQYIMPIFPFFVYFLFAGLKGISLSFDLSGKCRFANINASYLFGIALILVSLLYVSHNAYKSIIFNKTGGVIDGPYSPDSIEMFNYIKEHTGTDDAIIFHKPRAMILYTDRKSFAMDRFSFTPDKAYNSDARYVAISKKKYTDFDLRMEDFQGKLKCEFENSSFYLCDLRQTPHT
jgi:hypothetical protein